MTKFFKKFSKVQLFLIMIGVLCIGFYFYHSYRDLLPFNKAVVTVKEQTTNDGETVIQLKETNTNVTDEFPMSMSEEDVQQTIHEMSHQKVYAKQKWGGAIPLTHENVVRLLAVVKHNEKNYRNALIYENILQKWEAGDFSHVDLDHNTIWQLQDGTIGEATGIMTADDEKAYIELHFKIAQ